MTVRLLRIRLGRARRTRDQLGSALVETVWLGIILLVPLLWLVLSVFEVQRGAFAASGAVRSAGRAYMVAPSDAEGEAAARAVVAQVLADQGNGAMLGHTTFSCAPVGDCHRPGAVVTVQVKTSVRLPWIPRVMGHNPATFAIKVDHAVPFGEFRATAHPDESGND